MATEKTNNDVKIAGGFIKEKATIALSRWSKDEVARAIIKTTTTELEVPNEKHMLRLLQASFGDYSAGSKKYENVNGFIVDELEKKTHSRDWVVVMKAFLVLKRLMVEGSVSFNAELHKHRRIFCGSYIKALGDTPDGAAQQRVIEQFSQYMEERLLAEVACGLGFRMETEEFGVMMCTIVDIPALNKVMIPLLNQLQTLLLVEYSDYIVSNEATLLVFEHVVKDAKRLYVLLTDRIKIYLEEFDRADLTIKKQCHEIYRQYDSAIRKLAGYFESLRNGSRHFTTVIPDLKTLPASLLEGMELSILEGGRSSTKTTLNKELGVPTAGGSSNGGLSDLPKVVPLPFSMQPSTATNRNPSTLRDIVVVEEEQPPTQKNRGLSELFSPTVVSAPSVNAAPPVNLFGGSPTTSTASGSTGVSPTVSNANPLPSAPVAGGGAPVIAPTQRRSIPEVKNPEVKKEEDFLSSLFSGGGSTTTAPSSLPQQQQPPALPHQQMASPPPAQGGFDPFAAPQQPVARQPTPPVQAAGPMDFFSKTGSPTPTSTHAGVGPGHHHSNQVGNTAAVPANDPLTGKAKAW